MNETTGSSTASLLSAGTGYDPIGDRLRARVGASVETMSEEEPAEFPGRLRCGRGEGQARGYRHGHRERQLTGTFGTGTLRVPRARFEAEDGKVTERRSKALPRDKRSTKQAAAPVAAVHLAGTTTRRVKRAPFEPFEGAVGKDVVSRARAAWWTGARGAPAAWATGPSSA